MAFRVAGPGELEDCRGSDGDADAVGDDRRISRVTLVGVPRVLATDGVAHPVAEVDPCIAEADAGEGGGKEHLRLRFEVFWVFDSSREELDSAVEGFEGEDVGYGVGALVGWTVNGICGSRVRSW